MTAPQILEKLSPNEQAVRGFLTTLDRKQAIPTEFIAPSFAFVFNSDKPTDLHGWQELGKMWFTAFPGSKHACESTFAQGDRVFARLRTTGVHKGPLFGIPPSGKAIDIVGHVCFTFTGGKISRAEPVWDMLTLMQQIGAVPTPGQS